MLDSHSAKKRNALNGYGLLHDSFEKRGSDRTCQCPKHRYSQMGQRSGCNLPYLGSNLIDVKKKLCGVKTERMASRRQSQRPAIAVNQLDLHIRFELLELLGNRGLRDP